MGAALKLNVRFNFRVHCRTADETFQINGAGSVFVCPHCHESLEYFPALHALISDSRDSTRSHELEGVREAD